MLGDSFYPLTDFLERDIYNSLLLSCSVAVFNHYRHQAMGNTITALWLGSRVYLSKKSTTFACFKRLGACVYSVEDDFHPGRKEALAPLTVEERQHNRRILMQEYGQEKMKQRIAKVVEELTN